MSNFRKIYYSIILCFIGIFCISLCSCTEDFNQTSYSLDAPTNFRYTQEESSLYFFFDEVDGAEAYYIYVYNNDTNKLISKYYVTDFDGFIGYSISLNDGNYRMCIEAFNKTTDEKSKTTDFLYATIETLTEKTYTITYVLNGGSFISNYETTYISGTSYTLPTPVKDGYTFIGWYLSDDFSSSKVTKISTSASGDKVYYAYFVNNSEMVYTITYNLNGGSLPGDALYSYKAGDTYVLPTPTKDNATFDGWYLTSNFTGSTISTITSSYAENIEIYAKWTSTQDLEPYYADASNLTGAALKAALRKIISTGVKTLTYDDLKTKLPYTDADPNNSNNILLLFSHASVTGKWDGASTWNREHVWPQSKGWFKTSGAGSDIHHLRPEDPTVNSIHGNYPYGEITNGKNVTYNGNVIAHVNSSYFEPLDEFKGDIARIIFYLLVRYAESDSYNITNVA